MFADRAKAIPASGGKMDTVVVDDRAASAVEVRGSRTRPVFAWTACDLDAEKRCEREVERQSSWRARLLGWLIEYNRY